METATDNDETITVFKNDECALILREDGSCSAFLPKKYDGMETVPDHVVIIAALMTKIFDDEWVQNLINEFIEDDKKLNLE